MFGKLRIDPRRLDCDTRRIRSASFCTGCHALHEFSGRPASLLTNHDQTVLSVLLTGLAKQPAPAEPRRCTAAPWRTIHVQPLEEPARRLLASANAAAIAAKVRDDVDDEGGLLPRILLRLLRGTERRSLEALRALGFETDLITELGRVQSAAELDPTSGIDDLAAASGALTGEMFAHAARLQDRSANTVSHAHAFGAALGRHVYGEDAWQDHTDDLRRNRFNAWHHVHGGRLDSSAVAGWLLARLEDARSALANLDLGAGSKILTALLDTLEARDRQIPGRHARAEADARREAGDCDLACCCEGCGEGCCGGAGAEGSASAWACCDCCDCWCNRDRKAKRKKRRAARVHDRGRGTPEVLESIEP